MVRKIKLYSIGNQDKFSYYVFDKKRDVIEILLKIFLVDFDIYDLFEEPDKKGNYGKINVKKLIDVHRGSGDGKIKIDAFFGDKKMFLTIICSENLRLKFNESLFKYTKMPKSKKIKPKRKIEW